MTRPINTFENFQFEDISGRYLGVCSIMMYSKTKHGQAVIASNISVGDTRSVQHALSCIATTLSSLLNDEIDTQFVWFTPGLKSGKPRYKPAWI